MEEIRRFKVLRDFIVDNTLYEKNKMLEITSISITPAHAIIDNDDTKCIPNTMLLQNCTEITYAVDLVVLCDVCDEITLKDDLMPGDDIKECYECALEASS